MLRHLRRRRLSLFASPTRTVSFDLPNRVHKPKFNHIPSLHLDAGQFKEAFENAQKINAEGPVSKPAEESTESKPEAEAESESKPEEAAEEKEEPAAEEKKEEEKKEE